MIFRYITVITDVLKYTNFYINEIAIFKYNLDTYLWNSNPEKQRQKTINY